jgi:hypothetical protein
MAGWIDLGTNREGEKKNIRNWFKKGGKGIFGGYNYSKKNKIRQS